jgi:exosome complex component RRP41
MAIDLKDFGIKFKDLKGAAKALNAAKLTDEISVKVGVSGGEMLVAFIDAIDLVPADKTADIPAEAAEFYNNLPDEVFTALDDEDEDEADEDEEIEEDVEEDEEVEEEVEEDEEVEESVDEEPEEDVDEEPEEDVNEEEVEGGEGAEEEVTSECPVFKEGWNDEEEDCQDCSKETPDEYEACKKEVKAKAKAKKTRKKKTAPKAENEGKRSRYGHMPTSMAARIDDLVYQGGTREEIVKCIAKEFDRDEKRAASKVNSHIRTLITRKGITITDNDKGVKAKEKYAEGYTKENTVSTI